MKIISKEQLKAMPNNTVFFEYDRDVYDTLRLLRVIDKDGYENEDGFGFTESIMPDICICENDIDIYCARKPGALKTDERCLHDETCWEITDFAPSDRLYAVLEKSEILQMISVLTDALEEEDNDR